MQLTPNQNNAIDNIKDSITCYNDREIVSLDIDQHENKAITVIITYKWVNESATSYKAYNIGLKGGLKLLRKEVK